MLADGWYACDDHRYGARDGVGDGRATALVGDADDVGLGHQLEQLAGQVLRGSDAGVTVGQGPGLCLGVLDQLADGIRRLRRVDDDHVRHGCDIDDRGEIAFRVERKLRIEETGTLLASGLIAGEAILGILLAVLAVSTIPSLTHLIAGADRFSWFSAWGGWLSLGGFTAVAYALIVIPARFRKVGNS